MKNYVILGAGGHAKSLVEAITAKGGEISAYVDPRRCEWLECRHEKDEMAITPEDGSIIVGLGGICPDKLIYRLSILEQMLARDFDAPPIIHPQAQVSVNASLEPGVIIMRGAIIQPGASLGLGCIVNTGAIVEHDSNIGAGAHIAPGAIILGSCNIGKTSFIGAGAVVLQGQEVKKGSLIPALMKFSGKKNQS